MRVYLAGPDVFLPDAPQRFAAMRDICRHHGLVAISPLDPGAGEDGQAVMSGDAHGIARRNEAHIRGCDAMIANLTPFRGPGADTGTVYEVGFGRALGRPVFGYAMVRSLYADRIRALPGSTATHDGDGMAIESFGLFENLMVSCGIAASGGFVLTDQPADPWRDLSVFTRCVERAAAALLTGPTAAAPHARSEAGTP